jgi:hypothetical protein
MDTTMHLIARSVQLAVMAAPSSSLGEALGVARRPRESFKGVIRRALAGLSRSTTPQAA